MLPWKRNLYAVWFGQILSLMGFGFVLPFLPFYIQDLGVTDPKELRYWVGLISAVPGLSMGIMAPVWGYLADRYGRKLMVLRSLFGGMIIMFAMSRAGSVQAIFTLRVIQGLVTGSIAAAATLVAAGTPKDRLSYALGFLSSSTFIGYALGPFLGGLAAELFGYRTSFAVGSGILLAAFVIVMAAVKEIRTPEAPKDVTQAGDADKPFGILDSLKPPFIFLLLIIFLLRFSRSLPYPFIPIRVQEIRGTIEGSSAAVGFLSAAIGAVTAVSGLTLTRLGDRYNKIRIVSVFLAAAFVLSTPLFFTRGILSFSAVYIAISFSLGGVEPIIQSYLSGITPPGKRGVVFGVQTTVSSLGWFLAPLVGSWMSIAFSVSHVFLGFSASLLLSFIVTAVLSKGGRYR